MPLIFGQKMILGIDTQQLHSEIMTSIDRCAPNLNIPICRAIYNKPIVFLGKLAIKIIEPLSSENILSFVPAQFKPLLTIFAYIIIFKLISKYGLSNLPKLKNLSKKNVLVLLFSIIILSSFLRFYKLTSIPPGATLDEVSIGYNAFTIATTGTDQDGNFLPVGHFRSLADYKLPLEIYIVSFFQKLFGNTVLTIRFSAALFGSLTIISTFFLANLLFGTQVGLIAAFLLAISPWHAFHSHLGLETSAGLFFAVTGTVFLISFLKKQKMLIFAALFYIASIYTHHIFWVFLPLFVIIFFLINKTKLGKIDNKLLVLTGLIIVIAVIPFLTEGVKGNTARINQSFFSKNNLIKLETEADDYCNNLKPLCIPIVVGAKLINHSLYQYSSAYSLLSWYGPMGFDLVDVMPNRGLFYLFEFPLFIFGLVCLIKKKDKKAQFLLGWLLLYPAAIVLTKNLTAARMYTLLPLPQIVEGYALWIVFTRWKKTATALSVIILISFVRFLPDFWYVYPSIYSKQTDYGAQAVIKYVNNNPNKIFYIQDGFLHKLHFLYFFKVPQSRIMLEDIKEKNGFIVNYKNINLVTREYQPPNNPNTIFISLKEDIPKDYANINTISLLDNSFYASVSAPKEDKQY